MGVRSLRSSIFLSLSLHAIFFAACGVLAFQRAAQRPSKSTTWIELERLERLAHKKTGEKENPDRRLVQTEKGTLTEKPPEDAFLGARNQRVDQQTVSRDRKTLMATEAQRARSPQKKNPTGVKGLTKDSPQVLSQFGLPILPKRNLAEPSDSEADVPKWADLGSNPHDYIKGLRESERTALSTKEYVFYGYFQRIRERLDRAWLPILRARLIQYYRVGRQLATDMDHSTKLLVVLNPKGEIVRVQILSASGTRDLDDAAVNAFNRAGPFPNPPKGIIDKKGEIEIPWEFVLRT